VCNQDFEAWEIPKMRARFEGWYYKHQANGKSIALIPGRGKDHAFVQVITDKQAYNITYPLDEYQKGDTLHVGDNTFSPAGISVDIRRPELTLIGEIKYQNPVPIQGDIMGPFRFFPMECRHGIVSMNHTLHGTLTLDGSPYDFTGGKGYIESDSGRSFPRGYTWVQCNDFEADCSIMAAVARIPFYGLRFWGLICVVWQNGREYRFATYNGGKIIRCEPGIMVLKRGKYKLSITTDTRKGHSLAAPRAGEMSHVIRERLSCPARFRFTEGDHVLFDEKSDHASYEYEMEHVPFRNKSYDCAQN